MPCLLAFRIPLILLVPFSEGCFYAGRPFTVPLNNGLLWPIPARVGPFPCSPSPAALASPICELSRCFCGALQRIVPRCAAQLLPAISARFLYSKPQNGRTSFPQIWHSQKSAPRAFKVMQHPFPQPAPDSPRRYSNLVPCWPELRKRGLATVRRRGIGPMRQMQRGFVSNLVLLDKNTPISYHTTHPLRYKLKITK